MGFRIFPHSRWEGNLRLYAYQHPVEESALGCGLSFDQGIFGAHIFGRYGQNDDKIADWFGISSAWSAGTSFAMRIADRETVLGIGYSEINPRGGELENEKLLEIYFRHQLNKWVHVSPNLQVVWNAAGLSEDLTILGIRTHFSF